MREIPYWIRNLPHRLRGIKQELLNANKLGLTAELRAYHSRLGDLGVISRRFVTNAGAAFIVDALQNLTEAEAINYHDSGTGTNAENVTDTGLQTPTGGARVAGTQTEGTSVQYKSTATISYSGTFAITEHGIFTAAAAGTLFDRSVFAAVNVVSGDSITFAYTLTVNSGG